MARLIAGVSTAIFATRALAIESALPLHDPAAGAQDRALAGRLQYFAGNDALAMKEYQDDWQGDYRPREGDNLGVQSLRAEVSIRSWGIEVASLRRLEAYTRTARQTTDLLRIYKTKATAPANTAYNIDADYSAWEATGWRIGYAWQTEIFGDHHLTLGIARSELTAQRTRQGLANGSFDSLGGGNYNYRLSYDDAWTSKTYPFQTPGTPGAKGSAFDIAIDYRLPSGIRLQLIGNDLAGKLRWHDLPGTIATVANTGLTTTDTNGYINYQPALSGRNARRDFTQRLPERWAAGVEIPWRTLTASASATYQQGEAFPLLGLAWNFAGSWRVKADYDTRFRTWGAGISHDWGFVQLRASQRDLAKASAYGLTGGIQIRF